MKNEYPYNEFLPITAAECEARGWDAPDFVYVTGDAYVDHPSFGVAIISRVLESSGFRVAILAQPGCESGDDFRRFGKPKLGFLVTGGNIDSMVAHFTSDKKRRKYDYFSPGGKPGLRPDRAVITYCNRIRESYKDVPIIIGGLEASLRRFAHYDYWSDRVRRGILLDSRADIISYGMGEKSVPEIAKLLEKGVPVRKIRSVRGTAYLQKASEPQPEGTVFAGEFDDIVSDKAKYARAFKIQYDAMDSITGYPVAEGYKDRVLIQNPPSPPLSREELDRVYSLPYTRRYHPSYETDGGIPALTEVKFSVTHNRGCFGACSFCSIAYNQGREVRSRSIESVLDEIRLLTLMPDFKGYIHDIGGPTANFRYPSCSKQLTDGLCKNRRCLTPKPCKNLIADESEYCELLSRAEKIDGIKAVFIRSGIRYDYMLLDKKSGFFRKLVSDHVSGQLKVAPEHCSPQVLGLMGKPPIEVYEKFKDEYFRLCAECGKEQYLVPYLMSSHPGSTEKDAQILHEYIKTWGYDPEQVQDFYPTPGTASTCMFWTGLDPFTGKPVYVPRSPEEKRTQKKLLHVERKNHRTKKDHN